MNTFQCEIYKDISIWLDFEAQEPLKFTYCINQNVKLFQNINKKYKCIKLEVKSVLFKISNAQISELKKQQDFNIGCNVGNKLKFVSKG